MKWNKILRTKILILMKLSEISFPVEIHSEVMKSALKVIVFFSFFNITLFLS